MGSLGLSHHKKCLKSKIHHANGEIVDSGIRCQMKARTGTNRKTMVCRTAE
ncbi:hypothetical protein SVI_2968 [Shewanella violacea DSS12]|uniref:Uncharacterized protein n=1 Tax=Shewanella violacea (strain JCM 10179 / CIP 106290 / LMG 19151 / DSS12) TaxID=637905 RepID=D4ZA94_SHEVD|nr:hypothetical protein SVI_2968 [Shewanella violacea DSS12]